MDALPFQGLDRRRALDNRHHRVASRLLEGCLDIVRLEGFTRPWRQLDRLDRGRVLAKPVSATIMSGIIADRASCSRPRSTGEFPDRRPRSPENAVSRIS